MAKQQTSMAAIRKRLMDESAACERDRQQLDHYQQIRDGSPRIEKQIERLMAEIETRKQRMAEIRKQIRTPEHERETRIVAPNAET